MKALKYAALGIGAAVLIAGALAAYLVATFDPRDYAPRIAALVKEKTGRTLHIAGEFKLSFWPDLGVRLGAVSLSERDSEEAFADAKNVRFTVKLRPLLSRTLIAEDLLVQGAHVRITRLADGRLNIGDLFKRDGPAPQFDVSRVKIEASSVSYRDMPRGERYELSAIELETGRLTPSALTPLELSFGLREESRALDVKSTLRARLGIDVAQQRYGLDQANLQLTGRAGELTAIDAQVKGTFSAGTQSNELGATDVIASLSGTIRGEAIDANATIRRIAAGPSDVVVESPSVSLHAAGAAGATRMTLVAPALVGTEHAIDAETATFELDASRGAYALHGAVSSPLKFELPMRVLRLSKVDATISLRGGALPQKGVAAALTGDARLDFTGESMRAMLAGTVSGSRVKADLAATGIAKPIYRFVVDVDELDLDRYAFAGSPASGGSGLDVSSLSTLPATGTLHIGALRSGGVKARNVKLVVKP